MNQSSKRKSIIKVCKLYYYGGMSQEQIATLMQISRPKVSRLLAEAHQLNIVQIKIIDPLSSYAENSEKIRKHFNLKKVIVVPAGQNLSESKDNIGKAASQYLNDIMQPTTKIGIAWGTTLNSFVNHFQCNRNFPKATVLQLVGGTYSQTMNLDARELVKALAIKLNCNFHLLQAPLIVHNPTLRNLLFEEPEVIEHFALIEKLDVAFIGIGSSNYKDSIVFKAKYIEEVQAKELAKLGLICDICGHQIDIDGIEQKTFLSERLISTPLDTLKKIPLLVGLAAGSDKVLPILSSIHGGYLNALIIDEVAAISLIEIAKIP